MVTSVLLPLILLPVATLAQIQPVTPWTLPGKLKAGVAPIAVWSRQ